MAPSKHRHRSIRAGRVRAEKSIALVGNPNVGKSVIFGYLTGRYVVVSNYPDPDLFGIGLRPAAL